MKRYMRIFLPILLPQVLFTETYAQANTEEALTFSPIEHASFVIQANNMTIFVDPVGEIQSYKAFRKPDMILVTHAHHDHLNPEIINAVKQKNTTIIGPKLVIDKLKQGEIMKNGEHKTFGAVTVKAVPMYNLTKERLKFHKKGEGNGYVLSINKKRIYVAGDTEDIPEMKSLKDIDYAFVCMNLPYTMTVDQAASAVLAFKPKVVYPYHYRGKEGFSDLEKFKKLVSKNKDIEVRVLEWYK